MKAAIDATVDRFGSLTTLVNNAAPTEFISQTIKRLHEWTNEEWDRILLGTLTGPMFWSSKHAYHTSSPPEAVRSSTARPACRCRAFPAMRLRRQGRDELAQPIIATEYWREGFAATPSSSAGSSSTARTPARPPSESSRTVLGSRATSPTPHSGSPDESAFVTGSEVTVDGGQTMVGSYDEVTQTATKG